MIFAVKKYEHDDEFKLIFQALSEEQVTGIYGIIEQKQNRVHECYAGDLLYEFNGTVKSFRETIIEQNITYPAGVRGNLNKNIFRKRFEESKSGLFVPSSAAYEASSIEGFKPLGKGYKAGGMLGEGTVSIFYEISFLLFRTYV